MNPDPTLTRMADETAGWQPHEASRPGEAASAAQAPFVGTRRAIRRYELERSRRLAMIMLDHLIKGIDGKLFANAQDSVDKLKDPFLAMTRMQRELRRIVAQEERLDDEDAARAERLTAEGVSAETIDPAVVAAGRAARRDDLFRSQQMTMAMLSRLADGVSGLLDGNAQACVEKLKDPFLSMNRMQRELRRIVALGEQLDEDDAQRAKRLAAQAEAEEEAARDAERWEEGRAAREAEEAKKAAIRQAVTEAVRDARGDDGSLDDDYDEDEDDDDDDDRETLKSLLDDLFDDYDTYEDYRGDPAEIVAKMCAELGLRPRLDASDDDDDTGDEAEDDDDGGGDEDADVDDDPEAAEHALSVEIARGYLERAGWEVEPAPAQDAHSPPDG